MGVVGGCEQSAKSDLIERKDIDDKACQEAILEVLDCYDVAEGICTEDGAYDECEEEIEAAANLCGDEDDSDDEGDDDQPSDSPSGEGGSGGSSP